MAASAAAAAAAGRRSAPAPADAALPCPAALLLLPLTERVMALLTEEDARDACAAACVCKAWARAAAAPAVWCTIRVADSHRVRRARALTNARLAALVARAAGGLTGLDIAGCYKLTNAGLLPLAQQPHLQFVALCRGAPKLSTLRKYYERRRRTPPCRWFYGGNDDTARKRTQLTPAGIAAALRHAAPLCHLSVDGFRGQEARDRAHKHLNTLLPLVGGDATRLDVTLCGADGYVAVRGFFNDDPDYDEEEDAIWCEHLADDTPVQRCGCLLHREDARLALQCAVCDVAMCAHCESAQYISRCGDCGEFVCPACAEEECARGRYL
jgi:hypothetical protein